VQKRRVEYVIWPLIFQKRVIKEMVAEVKKSARAISDRDGIWNPYTIRERTP